MAASIKRTIRKTLKEIIEEKNITPAEWLEACKLAVERSQRIQS